MTYLLLWEVVLFRAEPMKTTFLLFCLTTKIADPYFELNAQAHMNSLWFFIFFSFQWTSASRKLVSDYYLILWNNRIYVMCACSSLIPVEHLWFFLYWNMFNEYKRILWNGLYIHHTFYLLNSNSIFDWYLHSSIENIFR